ncbi:DUF4012 domain-containing protein [Candidatus Microgenomates bacterium]|nr:DUF4012 domain-containing protein [Candidatus Microgenomates bacterium]
MPKRLLPLHLVNSIKGESIALVAGGAGFIGSKLCEELLKTCQVICLDNLRFGKRENIKHSLTNPRFTFIEHDITKPIGDLLRRKVHYIFHAAGVDDGQREEKASLENLLLNSNGTKNLLEKALSDGAKFLLVSTLKMEKNEEEAIDGAGARLFSESITAEYIKKFGVNGRIIRLGHLFGPRMPLNTKNPLAVIIKNLVTQEKVELANDEMTRLYPVFVDDCISPILKVMFDAGTAGKIFNLIPSRSITLLELAQILQEINPKFSLEFGGIGETIKPFSREHFTQGTTLALSYREEFIDQLKETLAFFQKNALFSKREKQPQPVKKNETFPLRFTITVFLIALLFFSIILPSFLMAAAGAVGIFQLNKAYGQAKNGQFTDAVKSASFGQQAFGAGKNALPFLSWQFSILGKESARDSIFLLFKSGEDASLSILNLSQASVSLGEFFQKSVSGNAHLAKPVFDKAQGEFNAAAEKISILEKELKMLTESSLPAPVAVYLNSKKEILTKQREAISLGQTFIALLPDLLGFDDKRVYLVLFQNNMELRATGGFIGSYGIVTFEKGSLISFDVSDVYAADGQLRGHVEPPLPIRKYLEQPNWFLRDSNWDVDFQNSAAQASFFLQKEVGISVSGVMAMDVTFTQFLLQSLGSVSLPDYKETITAENLFASAQAHAQDNFFPGSTQKKDFLSALSRRLIDKLLYEKNTPWLSVFEAVQKGAVQKHLLFSFNNEAVQKVFNLNNWGGRVLTADEKEGRFNDFRMLNEANLGVNKVNFWVKRKITDEITIDKDGLVSGKLSIFLTNDSSGELPGGSYISYLRAFFPKNTQITKITIDQEEQKEIDETTESGKSVFGFLANIAPRSTKVIAINYSLSALFPQVTGSSTYALIFQKQPGTNEDSLTVTINYPQELSIKETNASVFKEKQMITLSTDLGEDRLFTVEFLR